MLACQSTQGPIVQHKLQPIIKKKSFHTHTPPSRFQLDRTALNHPMSADHPSLSLPAEKTSHHSLSLSLSPIAHLIKAQTLPNQTKTKTSLSLWLASVFPILIQFTRKRTSLSLARVGVSYIYISWKKKREKTKKKLWISDTYATQIILDPKL